MAAKEPPKTPPINRNPKDPSSPYFLHHNDGPATLLTNHPLIAENYHSWAHTIRHSLRIKKKLGFIDGTLLEPPPTDALFEPWLECNDMVIIWLQNAMSLEIKNNVVYVNTAHDLWTELEQRFAQNNGPCIYELKQSIHNLTQGLFGELLNFEFIPPCTCGAMTHVFDNQQRDWMMKCLMGLNDSFSNIKAQPILLKPIPSLSKVYALVQQEEKHKQLSNPSPLHDTLALATKAPYSTNRYNPKPFSSPRRDKLFCTFCKVSGHSLEKCFKANPKLEKPTCTHCHLVGHTAERCYKLHGYPSGHKLATRS
ncbi:hypothetical protein I3843_07G193900 [Carya illinoinensis]|nr:hypothetical protein I3843_07G193900 [Carya illinoinensis]